MKLLHTQTYFLTLRPTQENIDEITKMVQTLAGTGGYAKVSASWDVKGRIFQRLSVQVEVESYDYDDVAKAGAYLVHCIS